jgi:hypothetical protein
MPEAEVASSLKIITKKEVLKHKTKKDLWVILHNQVYYPHLDERNNDSHDDRFTM